MATPQILVSGDYWHSDFREALSDLGAPATMVPLEKIDSVVESNFLIFVLAQSRRDQFSQVTVDRIRQQIPDTPIVNLLGTWCEGENRSGKPLIGVTRVPWQHWQSQFERFCMQMVEGVPTDWHQPLTATVADRSRDFAVDAGLRELLVGQKILISAQTTATFESLADMLKDYQCQSFRAEDSENLQASPNAIVVDGNGASEELKSTIERLRNTYGELPFVALLNFPRKQCFASLATLGIEEVVAKPFTHNEFLSSLTRAMRLRSIA